MYFFFKTLTFLSLNPNKIFSRNRLISIDKSKSGIKWVLQKIRIGALIGCCMKLG